MSGKKFDPAGDFESLARQYWSAWSQFAPMSGGMPKLPDFQDGLSWWTKLAGTGNDDANAMLDRMNAQAGDWFGAIQKLAAGFAGREASASDIGKAWREMLGGVQGNPMADMFKRMGGTGAHGIDAWMEQAAPFLGALRNETGTWLTLPAFGLGREHQERLQRLAQAQVAYQDRVNDYQGQLALTGKRAFEIFESKLGERSEPGRQLDSARALFDLWIDAAEEAWSEVALTPEYRRVYGELVNAMMRLRAAVQGEVERAAAQFGLPTRSEINASHRKLAALEREVRALKAQLAERAQPAASPVVEKPERATPHKPASRAKSPARKSVLPTITAPRALRSTTARKGNGGTRATRKGR